MSGASPRTVCQRLRFPTLEIFASESGAAFGSSGRPLIDTEHKLAKLVFEQSLDLDPIRIVHSRVAAAPTTLGNNIRTSQVMDHGTLIHELTHVWQYQNRGTRYISDSVCHQTVATFSSGSRNGAYSPNLVKGRKFDDYPAEHQAVIVERWFRYPTLRQDETYKALMETVRAARPLPANTRRKLFLDEAAYGPGASNRRLLPPPTGSPFERGPRGIPLVRFEF